ncbi:beta-lactamase family protein [Astrocystis sublimbata]|nr:beta-lactamase family protein [Astrocystis sublimbata]
MDLLESPDFPSHVEELIKKHHVPGLAVALIQDERVLSAGYGWASLDPPKPCTPDTLFDIASCSKSFTAASVALLVRDNDKYPDVKYDAVMSKLLPEDFVMSDQRYTDAVTVEDVLSHRTGLPMHDDSYLGQGAAKPDDARSVTRNLRNLEITEPIRSTYMYNNLMYTVATHLVETKSGLAFADFLQEHFFGPLGMTSTHLQPERARSHGLGDRMSYGYQWSTKDELYACFAGPQCPEGQGAGSIVTSVNDMIQWVKALMNKEHMIDEEVYEGLTTMRTFENPKHEYLEPFTSPAFYTVGLSCYYYRGVVIIGHDGGIDGFGGKFFFIPDFKVGCVILGNSIEAGNVADILGHELIDEVLGVPKSERPDWIQLKDDEIKRHEDDPDQRELQRILREESEPQKMPPSAYTGEYWNPGYKSMTVDAKKGKLFVDASDRSMPFTMDFDHVREQTEYIVLATNIPSKDSVLMRIKFLFRNDKAVKMAIDFTGEEFYIWFDRVDADALV